MDPGATFIPNVKVTVDGEKRVAYVTISEEGSYPSPQQLIEILYEKGIKYWIDEKLIHKELARQVCNQPLPVAFGKDAEGDIIIGESERKAYLVLKPAYGGRELTPDDIEAALASRGVVFGIDRDTIETVLSERQYNTRVLCAEAKEPVPGLDAEVHLNFRTHFQTKPKEIDHDKVDLRELGCVATVTVSRVIAWKSRATQGEPGMAVTGKPIPAKPGKEVLLRAGKGTHFSEDGTQVIADIEGQPVLKGNTLSVEPILTVPGDVDFSTGNIHFAGSLCIRGNVIGGFTVTATGNIEVDGFVESSIIEAGGNVVIKGGVQGRGSARIKAGGSVAMLFVEHARVEAGKDIVAAEVLHAELSAGEKILVNLGKGQVCGGVLRAGNVVEVRMLGSELSVPTKVAVGYDPHAKKRLESVKKEKSGLEEYLAKTEGGIATLEECKREGTFTSRRSEAYDRLLAARDQLREEAERIAHELTELEATVKQAATPEVKVRGTVFPNVTIRIKDARQLIRDGWKCATFYETEGEIRAMPFV
jgi:uncharacterized protein (DUF342 family)